MRTKPAADLEFSDRKGDISGYLRGWFFWVHEAFKPALDISYSEILDKEKTLKLRNSQAQVRGYKSLAMMQESIKAGGIALGDSSLNSEVMRYAIRIPVETQGMLPAFSFRAGDSLESRLGYWYVKVLSARPDERADAGIAPGELTFSLYRRRETAWEFSREITCYQHDFVSLLREGAYAGLSLADNSAAVNDEPTPRQASLLSPD